MAISYRWVFERENYKKEHAGEMASTAIVSAAAPHDFSDHKAHMQWKEERAKVQAANATVPLIPQDLSAGSKSSTLSSTVLQNAVKNPLVPIGMVATTGCLVGMLVSTLKRNSRNTQLFMRGRVVAQGLTVAALVGGALWFGIKPEYMNAPGPNNHPAADFEEIP